MLQFRKHFILIIGIWVALLLSLSDSNAEGIAFIVNAENPVKVISNQELGDIFLKKKREWSDGSSIRFIDRKDGSPERNLFLSQYIGRSLRDVELYWIGQKLYSGNAAPIQVASDQNAEMMVSSFRGGIAYVSSSYTIGKEVKKITILGNGVP